MPVDLCCPVTILIYLISLVTGLAMFFKAGAVIELQRRFYEKINWRIEPISMAREVRNTKLMGLLLSLAAPLAIFYILNLR
ncbi:MAG: hypothetical protein PHW98_02915 [Candidatus Omnitrophica bacterium]|nr:hypothetical protein [Candidatus Omnitrophota bacterium]MDD5770738.1 hypothetical protein [Candidatus Omnitrophota bacterium]